MIQIRTNDGKVFVGQTRFECLSKMSNFTFFQKEESWTFDQFVDWIIDEANTVKSLTIPAIPAGDENTRADDLVQALVDNNLATETVV